MKPILFILLLLSFGHHALAQTKFSTAEVTVLVDDKVSIRAIETVGDKVWYSGNQGRVGYYDLKEQTHFKKQVLFNSVGPDFRNLSSCGEGVCVLSAGSPALLYKLSADGSDITSVYRELHPAVFYDAMKFQDSKTGYAFGDPIEGKFAVLRTKDGGNTWNRETNLEADAVQGEASFAASNSLLFVTGRELKFFSGGTKSRFISVDIATGENREVILPIVQGSAMQGVFGAAFYDEKKGIVVGGDYDAPTDNRRNKAVTSDGGKSWQIVADGKAFGYASGVSYFPGSAGNAIVTVGATGLWYSADGGTTWTKLLDDPDLYVIKCTSADSAFAAGKNKLIQIRFK